MLQGFVSQVKVMYGSIFARSIGRLLNPGFMGFHWYITAPHVEMVACYLLSTASSDLLARVVFVAADHPVYLS